MLFVVCVVDICAVQYSYVCALTCISFCPTIASEQVAQPGGM